MGFLRLACENPLPVEADIFRRSAYSYPTHRVEASRVRFQRSQSQLVPRIFVLHPVKPHQRALERSLITQATLGS